MLFHIIKSFKLYFALSSKKEKKLAKFAKKNGMFYFFLAPEKSQNIKEIHFINKKSCIAQIENETGRVITDLFSSIDEKVIENDFVSCCHFAITSEGERVKLFTVDPFILANSNEILCFLKQNISNPLFKNYASSISALIERIEDCLDFRITFAKCADRVDWLRTGKSFVSLKEITSEETEPEKYENFFGTVKKETPSPEFISSLLNKDKMKWIIFSDTPGNIQRKSSKGFKRFTTILLLLFALLLVALFK